MSTHEDFITDYKENGFRDLKGTTKRHDKQYYKQGLTPYELACKREVDMKEHYIANAHQALLRERLAHCARTEGVNQFVNCKELIEQYTASVRDRYHGQLFAEGHEPKTRQTPGLLVKDVPMNYRDGK